MKYLKTLLGAAAIALTSFTSQAVPINVGGVIWDPDNASDFFMEYRFYQDFTGDPAIAGTELFGLGIVYGLNNDLLGFCPGCELTFKFGGFKSDGAGGFDSGTGLVGSPYIKFYVDHTPNYDYGGDPFNAAAATDGVLWLELFAGNVNFNTTSGDASNPYLSGFLNIEWFLGDNTALAFNNFVMATQPGGGDAYSSAQATFGLSNNPHGGARGNGTLDAVTVPEPGVLFLFGAALVGLGVMRKKVN